MATKPDDEQESLELTEELEPGEPEEQPENPGDAGEEEPTVSFEGEEPPEAQPENSVIRDFRRREREKDKRIAELEKQVAPKQIEVGEEPTMAGCDYDEDHFKTEWKAWNERNAAAERQNASQAEQTRIANEQWQSDLAEFQQKKAGLQFDDADDTIDTATMSLDVIQQAVIVKAAADPALFLYALGKSEAKRAELAKIQDPIKLAAAVARMEGAVKVTNRKPPNPDRPARGSAVMPAGGTDKELERLEKEADRTGNRTAVINYKRAQKAAAEAK